MSKIAYADMPIHVFMPMSDGQPFLALIGSSPILFRGATPFAVHKAAADWRQAEIAKVDAAKANAEKRLAASRAARSARVEGVVS